jgi:hypothetical protein
MPDDLREYIKRFAHENRISENAAILIMIRAGIPHVTKMMKHDLV